MEINALLAEALSREASDLHLTVGVPPFIRVHGELIRLDHEALEKESLENVLYAILTEHQREILNDAWELDFAYSLPGEGRFRVNYFFQRGSIAAAFRHIPIKIKTLEELGMPKSLEPLAYKARGLVIVTGPTGSGKSTTLAAMIDIINRNRKCHIVTVEDPIEYLHQHHMSVVNQREVDSDTKSFAEALKHVLRQDPDVILLGEMRDIDTIGAALTAAETGHLVFSTLHTQDAPQAIDRIIDVFPPYQQDQVRSQLAGALQGIISQQLLPTADNAGRVAAVEVMLLTPAIRNLVRERKTHQIYTAIETSQELGMQTMDQCLANLYRTKKISYDMALARAIDMHDLKQRLERTSVLR